MNKCYYVHCPLPCPLQKRGKNCPEPYRRKGHTKPIEVFFNEPQKGTKATDKPTTKEERCANPKCRKIPTWKGPGKDVVKK